ncbi:MMPL family transporter [Exiguobacterium aurantiacum]|uniref:Membrane protein ydgH n=1 Tax=Exiguobacterium aurantiacum TaxID=33987 RepID=A0A377FQ82_9BACL|nr:MMPL family transporter [Exiguobacterium aurantiacum]STO06858.1 Putative membrane protein ydgH [Exiguobacterium aurantiacum]
MRNIIQWRWGILIGLIVLTAGLFIAAPNLTKQAEQAGSFQLSEDMDSQRAQDILNAAGKSDKTISLVYEFDSLGEAERTDISRVIRDIETRDDVVKDVLDPFENEETEAQLVSEDERIVLVPITVEGSSEAINAFADDVRANVLPEDETVYITGEEIINNDVNLSAQEGLKKTEIITVVLIFSLLLLVFRSIVTPFIPLIAVGFTYLLSQSFVAFFVDWFGFPVSNYTQIFLVAILFGIGTDYCILLLSRYKEELGAGHTIEDAIVNTYKTAGRTVLISGLAVFVGFASIGFADFPIFKSAVAVAVGIAVLLLILFTVVPFFMATLKHRLFWPSKKAGEHHDSRLWAAFSRLSVNRPFVSILVVAAITVPVLFTYDDARSFNTVDEIGNDYDSVRGLNLISEGFGKGESLPVQVILKRDAALTEDDVAYIEKFSYELENVDGVSGVRSITRPTGDVIDDFYVDTQLAEVSRGLAEAESGLGDVQAGLAQVESGLDAVVAQLPTGSSSAGAPLAEAAAGLGQLNAQLGLIGQGLTATQNIPATVAGIGQVSVGLGQIEAGINEAASALTAQGAQIGELGAGLSQLATGVGEANAGLSQIEAGLGEAVSFLSALSEADGLRDTGVFLPEGTLTSDAFAPAVDRYVFDGGTATQLEVVLDMDPYSPEAIDTVEAVKETMDRIVTNTPFEAATIGYAGISSINSDLNATSTNDFNRTVAIMLVTLFVVMTILFRSMIMPLYMIGSLLLTYYTSAAITELIFVEGLGYDGISWAVPFFGFVMLIALGIDYSIFLLDRFREESINGMTVRDALVHSMTKMGTVIMTAAVILAGTFGAMIPSGVLSLVQIATIVITGLLLYGLIVLPLLIPAITVSFGDGVWWPFKPKKKDE